MQACIHMPRGSHRTSRRENLDGTGGTGTSTAGKPSHWEQLLAVLDALRAELKANYVPPFLQRKLFVQLFSFINVQLFNQLLLRRECCSFANGEYVKNGLAQVRLLAELMLEGGTRGPQSNDSALRAPCQLFSFITVQLFDLLLLLHECCSFPNGEFVENGLVQVRLLAELMLEGGNKRSSIK
jgi:hypothetical protein